MLILPIFSTVAIIIPIVIYKKLKKHHPIKINFYSFIINWGDYVFNVKRKYFYFELIRTIYKTFVMFGLSLLLSQN